MLLNIIQLVLLLYIYSACTADFPLETIKLKPSTNTWYTTSKTNEFLESSKIELVCPTSYMKKMNNLLNISSNIVYTNLTCRNGSFSPSYNKTCAKS